MVSTKPAPARGSGAVADRERAGAPVRHLEAQRHRLPGEDVEGERGGDVDPGLAGLGIGVGYRPGEAMSARTVVVDDLDLPAAPRLEDEDENAIHVVSLDLQGRVGHLGPRAARLVEDRCRGRESRIADRISGVGLESDRRMRWPEAAQPAPSLTTRMNIAFSPVPESTPTSSLIAVSGLEPAAATVRGAVWEWDIRRTPFGCSFSRHSTVKLSSLRTEPAAVVTRTFWVPVVPTGDLGVDLSCCEADHRGRDRAELDRDGREVEIRAEQRDVLADTADLGTELVRAKARRPGVSQRGSRRY